MRVCVGRDLEKYMYMHKLGIAMVWCSFNFIFMAYLNVSVLDSALDPRVCFDLVGEPKMFQNRRVSSAAADTTLEPSGDWSR